MSLKSILRCLLTLGRGVSRSLPAATADREPIELFQQWFEEAREAGLLLPEAMAVATCTTDGYPSVRMMLLKAVNTHGFEFYTNYNSRKAIELAENSRAALVFHWAALQRQVRIEGSVSRLKPDESFSYFLTRPRGSRIGAWASKQSQVLEHQDQLQDQVRRVQQQFQGQDVPLPPHWGGFQLTPQRIEFWQGQTNRLHDRLCFDREDNQWRCTRLYP